jgi:chaperone modulatory protein CbpM
MTTALIRIRSQSGQSSQISQIKGGKRMNLESFAAAAGLHPEFVLRLVSLGLIEAGSGSSQDPDEGPTQGRPAGRPGAGSPGATGELWFSPAQLAVAARIQRLRSGLALNYASLGLVIDLLDRVAELESALRKAQRGERRWTRTV